MDNNQIQQDISLIKEMIAKTRRDAADSGHFFIFLGIIFGFALAIILPWPAHLSHTFIFTPSIVAV